MSVYVGWRLPEPVSTLSDLSSAAPSNKTRPSILTKGVGLDVLRKKKTFKVARINTLTNLRKVEDLKLVGGAVYYFMLACLLSKFTEKQRGNKTITAFIWCLPLFWNRGAFHTWPQNISFVSSHKKKSDCLRKLPTKCWHNIITYYQMIDSCHSASIYLIWWHRNLVNIRHFAGSRKHSLFFVTAGRTFQWVMFISTVLLKPDSIEHSAEEQLGNKH